MIYEAKVFNKIEIIPNNSEQTEQVMVELTSINIKLNSISKGGNFYESTTNIGDLKQKICEIEFLTAPMPTQIKSPYIITKLDGKAQLSFTVLNSPHMLYCSALFSSFDTSLSVSIKLFDFVKPDDCPSFDNRGKTNLCIDDVAWTNNDAFVILLFNSCTFAILPRLGNSLIAIYNPTLQNISMKGTGDASSQYKLPRTFNELILPLPVVQKHSQIKQSILQNRKIIRMHHSEEQFLISDSGISMCFNFKMEFEPELSELFGKSNMSFFFVRFCISLERLAVDQDILEKIPQLLTNKLPLFEFDKNAEFDEEEDPGQIIMTASQINPFEHGMKKMETNQSFNAEFALDSQEVLLNLKHLLMGLRWNKSSPINYFQWIVTVVNDCFFYFLKNSEPLYAYHALRIGEAYCRNILFPSITQETENKDKEKAQQFSKNFDPIHDMYDYHNTKDYMSKGTSEKLEIKHDLFETLPARLTRGSGHWSFQFTKNYTLLVYYSLIQFRNYQAANFNILFLVFACYIMQRYLDSMLHSHIQQVIEIVQRNFQLKKKSDDYELFLGKSGKNMILGPAERIKAYHNWMTLVLKFNLDHLNMIYDQENFEVIMDTSIITIIGSSDKIEKNLGYLGHIGKIIAFINSLNTSILNQSKSQDALTLLKSFNSEPLSKSSIFQQCTSLYLLASYINSNDIQGQPQTATILTFLQSLHKMMIHSTASASTNFISQFGMTMDRLCFKRYAGGITAMLLGEDRKLAIKQQLVAIMYMQVNEVMKAADTLKEDDQETKVFKILILSNAIKSSLKQIESVNSIMQSLDHQQNQGPNLNTKEHIGKFQIKASCIQTIRKSLAIIKDTFQTICEGQDTKDQQFTQYEAIAATFITLPQNSENILREQLLYQSVKNMHKIVKYIKGSILNLKIVNEDTNSTPGLGEQFLKEYLKQHCNVDSEESIENSLNQLLGCTHLPLKKLFYHFLTQSLLCLAVYSQSKIIPLIHFDDNSYQLTINQELHLNLLPLITKSFKRLTNIFAFITIQVTMMNLESRMINNCNRRIQEREIIDEEEIQIAFFEQLLKVAKFEKYHHSQVMISKAINVARMMVHPDKETKLIKGFSMITFSSLNRANKQKVATILEQVKGQQKDKMKAFINTLENLLFSNNAISNETTNLDQTGQDLQANEIENKLLTFLQSFPHLKSFHETVDLIVKGMKFKLLERCLELRDMIGISFDESYFYDKTTFVSRPLHILGLTNSILDKFKKLKEKRLHQKKFQEEDDVQLSFRVTKVEVQPRGEHVMSLESARHYEKIVESPRISTTEVKPHTSSIVLPNDIPQSEIIKSLMKGRQQGQPETPRGQKDKSVIIDLQRLSQAKQVQRRRNLSHIPDIRIEDAEDAVKEPIQYAQINEEAETKRKNSVRRYIGVAFQVINKNQTVEHEEETVIQQLQQVPATKPQHRKGQMSVAINQGNNFGSFNFGNQKNSSQFKQIQATQNNKSGPPPGLPKSIIFPHKRMISSKQSNTSFDQIHRFTSILESFILKKALRHWQHVSSTKRPDKNSRIKTSSLSPFNLLLVKKDGTSISLTDMNHAIFNKNTRVLKQPEKVQKPKVSKEQKRQIMKKFKQISEKLEKVQREADALNQDFMQKLN